MYFLPFLGLRRAVEGQDRDHPIVLEGCTKDEFTCLLVENDVSDVCSLMFTTSYTISFLPVDFDRARTLISGRNLELHLNKDEWVSVLKLSTIWNMTKVCRMQLLRLDRLTLDIY